eukprot:TRINITY_DN1494_c0_g1_i1.p1 TRINITY_DN1494_c0_g1~~TRINITY_DN1494_c0_g1_i1.p1  ORF type:complete len:130 (-),score=20.81 TRINITY_DN1494_c0_g1_i1:26-415(-)
MTTKTKRKHKRLRDRAAGVVPKVSQPRALARAKHHLHSKRKYRLLGLAPTPGVYDDFDSKGREAYKCPEGHEVKTKGFCVQCAVMAAKQQQNQRLQAPAEAEPTEVQGTTLAAVRASLTGRKKVATKKK